MGTAYCFSPNVSATCNVSVSVSSRTHNVSSRSRLGLGRKGLVHIISGEYTENTTVLLPVKKPDQQLAATLCESGSPQISAEVSARLQYREYGTKTGVTGVVSLSEK